MPLISWDDFMKVGLYFGTIVKAEFFAEARKPSYKLWIDLGPEIGVKKSSSQIAKQYKTAEELLGKQVLCVVNFPNKQIGPFISEVLTTGADDAEGKTVLVVPEGKLPNGARLY
ncbi:MAG: tRNA-binding protein [Alphaproteobacteria bacterium]|nr:tRNA-binding protein [Alphaproteobacteria bacterium]